jgi:hypothetical protein
VKWLLRRIARRCEIHDRAWPSVIRALEADLGLPLTPGTGRLSDYYGNPRLIGCGHNWCRDPRERH